MKVYAAIDLRDGAAVQLVGGDPADERVRLPDPASVARRWIDAGFRRLHAVDLDAALGQGDNAPALAAVARACRGRASLRVGGGIRDDHAIDRTLGLGAGEVIVGTRAVEDPAWLRSAARARPGRLVAAADVRDGVVLTRGWTGATELDAAAFLRELDALPLGGVLVTDVGREGREAGIDAGLFRRLAGATSHPLAAAGGIASAADLEALAAAGVDGAVLGMALYTGRLDPAAALRWEEQDR